MHKYVYIITYRAAGAEGLHTSGVVILNAAARIFLELSGLLDQADDLCIPTDAGGEFCPQVDEVFLKIDGNDFKDQKKCGNTHAKHRLRW